MSFATNWPIIKNELAKHFTLKPELCAYVIATVYTETATFKPISEYVSKYNTTNPKTPFHLYDFRSDLGNNSVGAGAFYKGRGFIQLTGRANYASASTDLRIPTLLINPDLANDPQTAARILVWFLSKKKGHILEALRTGDLKRLRRLVNGGLHGYTTFEHMYKRALKDKSYELG
jgi:putative chitinase